MEAGNYILANAILADRRREAEHRRLVAELKAADRAERQNRASRRGLWRLEWGNNGFTGKPVTLVNTVTGERLTGRDPGDWDKAMGRALRVAAAETSQPAGITLAG